MDKHISGPPTYSKQAKSNFERPGDPTNSNVSGERFHRIETVPTSVLMNEFCSKSRFSIRKN